MSEIEIDSNERPAASPFTVALSGVSSFIGNLSSLLSPSIENLRNPNDIFTVWGAFTGLNTALFRLCETLVKNTIQIGPCPDEARVKMIKDYSSVLGAIYARKNIIDDDEGRRLLASEQALTAQIKESCQHMTVDQVCDLVVAHFKYLLTIDSSAAYQDFVRKLLGSNFFIYNRLETDKLICDALYVIRSSYQDLQHKGSRCWGAVEDIFASPLVMQYFHNLASPAISS